MKSCQRIILSQPDSRGYCINKSKKKKQMLDEGVGVLWGLWKFAKSSASMFLWKSYAAIVHTAPSELGDRLILVQRLTKFWANQVFSDRRHWPSQSIWQSQNLTESLISRKSHCLLPGVTSSLLIRLQSSCYLSWLLSETFENLVYDLLRWDLSPIGVPNAKRLSLKIQVGPAGRCSTPHW